MNNLFLFFNTINLKSCCTSTQFQFATFYSFFFICKIHIFVRTIWSLFFMLPFFTFPLQLPLIFLYIFFKNTYYKAYSNKEGFGFKLYLPLYNLDPCNRIYAPYRPRLSYFQGMKLYKNYSTLIYNYPIFQRLGLDPSYVHIHKYITEKNKSIIKS